jgi:ADP-dependent NAD(P)H-hydrate dehydratase / NAD(P)H-hydrate epimerase
MSSLDLPYSRLVSTGKQCRECDHRTIETFGIDGFTLMETAASGAAEEIQAREPDQSTGLFLCGKGNNAGDALAVARNLAIHAGHNCLIALTEPREDLSPDAKQNLVLLESLAENGYTIQFLGEQSLWVNRMSDADYLVDGLFGTGLSSTLRDPYPTYINLINRFKGTVFSMDIPSGLHSDLGKPMPVAVEASVTVSFGSLKPGFYLEEGPLHSGEIVHINLPFPDYLRTGVAELLSPDDRKTLPDIKRKARHKYDGGVVYVAAGSEGLTGAAILASRAAWKAGAGAVFLFAPRGLLPVYEAALPGIIKIPLGSRDEYGFHPSHLETIHTTLSKRPGVLLLGPGIGRTEETKAFTRELLKRSSGNTVVDADAIHGVQPEESELLSGKIVTPHPGELSHLLGASPKNEFDRLTQVASRAHTHQMHLVAKGSPTIVGLPDSLPMITGYDTTLFSRAGFGDLLSGTIAGYLAIHSDKSLAIARALLDGYQQLIRAGSDNRSTPEPGDLV